MIHHQPAIGVIYPPSAEKVRVFRLFSKTAGPFNAKLVPIVMRLRMALYLNVDDLQHNLEPHLASPSIRNRLVESVRLRTSQEKVPTSEVGLGSFAFHEVEADRPRTWLKCRIVVLSRTRPIWINEWNLCRMSFWLKTTIKTVMDACGSFW